MRDQDFNRFCEIAYHKAGIRIREGKESLVSSRVSKRLRALRLPDECSYLKFLEADDSGEELIQFLDAITTNFTSFFRESVHFEILENYLKVRYNRGQRKFRLWCAASSTGEEPYSLALTVREVLGDDCDVRILCTDISTKVLEIAKKGEYEKEKIKEIPSSKLNKYFKRTDRGFLAGEELKQILTFKRLNLATPPFPMKGPLDAVFCRNVMIYFDRPVRQRLVLAIDQLLAPGAMLFIGHTETLTGIKSSLVIQQPSIYRKPGES